MDQILANIRGLLDFSYLPKKAIYQNTTITNCLLNIFFIFNSIFYYIGDIQIELRPIAHIALLELDNDAITGDINELLPDALRRTAMRADPLVHTRDFEHYDVFHTTRACLSLSVGGRFRLRPFRTRLAAAQVRLSRASKAHPEV